MSNFSSKLFSVKLFAGKLFSGGIQLQTLRDVTYDIFVKSKLKTNYVILQSKNSIFLRDV